MRIEEDIKLDYSNVLIRPKRSTLGSRKEVDLERGFKFRNYKGDTLDDYRHYRGVPIMASNMDGVGTFVMADILAKQQMFTCLVKTLAVDELVDYFNAKNDFRREHVAMSIGITDNDSAKFKEVFKQVDKGNLKYVCIDVANGYSERFSNFVRKFRKQYSNIVIIAGNVVTGEMTEELILNGADIVKVGIGPGSVCTTRIQTGVGYPQLSAVIECADAAHGLGGHIIADGGCASPGDVVKAFAGGADFVMLGGMLAGHTECKGEILGNHRGGTMFRQKMKFYGMSSDEAQLAYYGEKKSHRASEGKVVQVPYRGYISKTIQEILGGLRSACTYAGAKTIKSLPKCTTFVKVNRQLNEVFS